MAFNLFVNWRPDVFNEQARAGMNAIFVGLWARSLDQAEGVDIWPDLIFVGLNYVTHFIMKALLPSFMDATMLFNANSSAMGKVLGEETAAVVF